VHEGGLCKAALAAVLQAADGRPVRRVRPARRLAKDEVAGVRRDVSVALLPGPGEPAVGDDLLIRVALVDAAEREPDGGATKCWEG
jgi:hypothetical protein